MGLLINSRFFLQATMTNDDDNAKFEIPRSERGDTGKYTIALKNEFGEDEGDINVIVLGQ